MHCKNCNIELLQNADYCYSCGAKVIRNRLTFKNLLNDFGATFLNVDNIFLRTYKTMFTKPEAVIDSYINGTRKKFAGVVSYFAIAITVTGLYVFVQRKFFPDLLDAAMFGHYGQEEMQKEWMSIVLDYMSLFMMMYIPLYAMIARLTFLGLKKYNFTELLVVFMYLQAQMSLTTSVLYIFILIFGGNIGYSSLFLTGLMILYSAYCLKRLYGLTIGKMLLRTLLFFAILFVLYIIMAIILVVVWYLNGDLERMIEAQRATRQAN